jgi:hypothetical protein
MLRFLTNLLFGRDTVKAALYDFRKAAKRLENIQSENLADAEYEAKLATEALNRRDAARHEAHKAEVARKRIVSFFGDEGEEVLA